MKSQSVLVLAFVALTMAAPAAKTEEKRTLFDTWAVPPGVEGETATEEKRALFDTWMVPPGAEGEAAAEKEKRALFDTWMVPPGAEGETPESA
ncbi:hypothetical protein B0H66DRAFT_640692 [Apodospora peruviana]|uniref:Uncharacterized protein n=1 Tax=Apodospora peruviana TaxID=516989 RepID=A0AAE0HZV1_9PEZI|nr:hypothetical protein B0H66DRAFT_640692 [Apodospora peruviana]